MDKGILCQDIQAILRQRPSDPKPQLINQQQAYELEKEIYRISGEVTPINNHLRHFKDDVDFDPSTPEGTSHGIVQGYRFPVRSGLSVEYLMEKDINFLRDVVDILGFGKLDWNFSDLLSIAWWMSIPVSCPIPLQLNPLAIAYIDCLTNEQLFDRMTRSFDPETLSSKKKKKEKGKPKRWNYGQNKALMIFALSTTFVPVENIPGIPAFKSCLIDTSLSKGQECGNPTKSPFYRELTHWEPIIVLRMARDVYDYFQSWEENLEVPIVTPYWYLVGERGRISVLENIVLSDTPTEGWVRYYGVVPPRDIIVPKDQEDYFWANLRNYLPIFTRVHPPKPPPVSVFKGQDRINVVQQISVYSDVELLNAYNLPISNWTSRIDLLDRIADLLRG